MPLLLRERKFVLLIKEKIQAYRKILLRTSLRSVSVVMSSIWSLEKALLLSHRFGIKGNALAWFDSYLKSRKQFVQIEDCQSSQSCLAHGVPQGSVLGFLLYLLYTSPIADIINLHSLQYHLYADDSQLYISLKLTALLTSLKLSHLLRYVSKILTGG